jgi:hypothetical protein
MAKAIAGTGGLLPQAPRRRGKYDSWLDGRIWEVSPKLDARPTWSQQRLLRALRERARRRGLRVGWQPLEDGAISVQALQRRAE